MNIREAAEYAGVSFNVIMDAIKKKELLHVIRRLKAEGMTLLIVTHDVEFAALCADRCALFFRGNIASRGTPEEFFWENSFYTTAAARLAKGYAEKAVTVEEIARRYAKERKQ
jgi:energy-coupling factor transport system ATP-binding protein